MKGDPERPLIRKAFPGYILTYALSSLGGCVSSLADSLVVSNLMTANDLACMGVITPYYTILSMLGAFFYTGAQIQCSRALSNGEKERSDAWFSLTVEAALFFSTGLMLLCFLFSRGIAVGLGVSPENAELLRCVQAFNRGFFLNIPLSLLNSVLVMSANADGDRKLVSVSVAVTVIVDVIGNLLSVTVFHAGIFGIALSTTAATLSADIILAARILRGRSAFHLKRTPLRLSMLADVWKFGLPKLTNKLLVIIGTLLLNRLLLRTGGTPAMGALSVLGSLSHILLAPAVGICSTAFLMTSTYYGDGDIGSLREIYRCVLLYAFAGMGALMALVLAFAPLIVSLFLREKGGLFDITVRALRIYAFSLPLAGLAEGLFGYIQGSGKTGIAQLFTVSAQVGRVAVMYALAALTGTDGIWGSYSLGALPGLIMCGGAILLTERGEGASLSDRLLLVSACAREARENSLYASVKTGADAAGVSERIRLFCAARGLEKRRAFIAALCAEEMAKNVVEHGFKYPAKNYCSVSLLLRGGDIVLRIRDDCETFNTQEYFLRHPDPADGFSNIGIRLACSVAKDLQYVSLLKTNTLIIRI